MFDFKQKYDEYYNYFNEILTEYCRNLDGCPQILADSMRYSLTLGGKRLRPVLTFASAELLGVGLKKVAPFALALEMIHTYSLIHDDLPEMDNDDFRRGKPSNHKVFGTGNAVLAGDGLLNSAYSLLFHECRKGAEYVAAAEFICDCAGIYGMIGGQSADLSHESDDTVDEGVLNYIYENKTAKLITAPLVVPSILSGGRYFTELKAFGEDLGYLFQLTDDILDVEGSFDSLGKSTGKDKEEGKYTSIKLYGLDVSKLRADVIASKCRGMLESLDADVTFFSQLVDYVRYRTH